MKRILVCMLCFMLALAVTVSAAVAPTYTIDSATNTINITGAVDVKEGEEATVALHVLNPGKTYENSNPNVIESVAYVAEDVTEKGVYSFSFELTNTGIYNAYISGLENGLAVDFVNYEELKQAIEDINDAALVSYEQFETVFDTKLAELRLANYPLYSKVTKSDVMKRIYDETPLDSANGYEVSESLRATIVLVALNEGKVENIGDYATEMAITTGEMKDWYAKSCVTDKVKAAVTSRISNRDIDDMAEFNDLFKEALILEIIKDPGTSANVKPLIKEFADDIGVNADGISDSTYLEIVGEDFEDYGDLCLALEEDDDGDSFGGGGGGSSGGGGYASGSGIGTGVSLPNISPAVQVSAIKGFTDLGSVEWAKDAITELADMSIVSYNEEKKFYPAANVTREEFVKLLVTLFGLEIKNSEIPFADVKSGDWFYPYIATAYENGLCRGISETEFGSGLPIRRQDIAVMVCRALETRGKTLENLREPLNFVDSADIDSYAVDSVNSLCSAKILNGNENGEFLPKSNATRAEAAVIIHKLIKYAK